MKNNIMFIIIACGLVSSAAFADDAPSTAELLVGISRAFTEVGSQQVFVNASDKSVLKMSVSDVLIQALTLSDSLKIEKSCKLQGGRHQGIDTYECTINFHGLGPMDGSSFKIKANAEVDSAKNQGRVNITGNVEVTDIAG